MLQSRKEAIREGLFGIGFVALFCSAMIYFTASGVDVGAWVGVLLFGLIGVALLVMLFAIVVNILGRLLRSR